MDPTGTKCSGPKPATQQECNDIPCTGQLLIIALKNQTDNILATVNGTVPPGSSALISSISPAGSHAVVSVNSADVPTVQKSWQVAMQWPDAVKDQFDAMIGAKSETYQAFQYFYHPDASKWMVVVGAARSVNGTVDMAYVSAYATGVPITQHYGTDKTIDCGTQDVPSYTTSGILCGEVNPECGTLTHCQNWGHCPTDCPCLPCQCKVTAQFPPGHVRVSFSANCAQLLGNDALEQQACAVSSPPTCQLEWGECNVVVAPCGDRAVDFSGCRNPSTVKQCNKPLLPDQVSEWGGTRTHLFLTLLFILHRLSSFMMHLRRQLFHKFLLTWIFWQRHFISLSHTRDMCSPWKTKIF